MGFVIAGISLALSPFVWFEMDYFDKRMALEVIEDAFTNMGTPEAHGFATGLCGAFYMCGLLEEGEWRALLRRIPAIHVAPLSQQG